MVASETAKLLRQFLVALETTGLSTDEWEVKRGQQSAFTWLGSSYLVDATARIKLWMI